jgi:hypothetical protein
MLNIAKHNYNRLRLRWRFEYADKPAKYGGWDYLGDDPGLSAWRQPREGMVMAILEAKTSDGVILQLVECPGQDFCNFQWEMEARLNAGSLAHRHVGLTLVSRSYRYTVFVNGNTNAEPRKESDRDNQYLYGKV